MVSVRATLSYWYLALVHGCLVISLLAWYRTNQGGSPHHRLCFRSCTSGEANTDDVQHFNLQHAVYWQCHSAGLSAMTFEMKRNQAGFTCRRRAATTQHFLLSSTLVLDKTPPNNTKKNYNYNNTISYGVSLLLWTFLPVMGYVIQSTDAWKKVMAASV